MVKSLEVAGVRDSTIIIIWGDHGWHPGDMGVWGKTTNYEIATRVPLMIWTPNRKNGGVKTDALVQVVETSIRHAATWQAYQSRTTWKAKVSCRC